MDDRQRSHRNEADVDINPLEHEREEDKAGGWPGKRSLTQAGAAGSQAQLEDAWPGKRSLTQDLNASSGQALPGGLQTQLERSLGANLGGVRIHTDEHAEQAAAGMNAKAFTVGQAVYFNRGYFDPSSQSGQRLIAHEVAHTVQQGGVSGRPQLDSLGISSPGDSHETEAESFASSFVARPGAKSSVTQVSRSVISRAVIQRDLLDGNAPSGLDKAPAPLNAAEPTPAELKQRAAEAIKRARGQGGTNAVVAMVRQLRSQGTAATSAATEAAISSELKPEEQTALNGGTAKSSSNTDVGGSKSGETSGKGGGGGDAATSKSAETSGKGGTGSDAASTKGGDVVPGSGNGANTDPATSKSGDAGTSKGGDASKGDAASKADAAAKGGGESDATTKSGEVAGKGGGGGDAASSKSGEVAGKGGGGGDSKAETAGETSESHDHSSEVSALGGKELIEQELAFHEQWKVYSDGGAAGRAAHLAKTMFVGNDGSALHGDLAQGAIGAGTQFGVGLGVKLLATKTLASRIPGVGNIIGGAFSAYSLFSNGGAGIKKMGSEISEGIGGAFSAKNWSESPWLTAANLVSGIKSVFELVGHVCNILSGLAYAFAAIAALGGLLSVFFPPLAMLLPYIPMAINFGRACGGIATVCMGVANLLSPIPPILRAIHLIFSDNDPIKLVGAETKYHEDVQGALATYGAAKANNALAAKGSKTLGIAADPNAPKSVYGKGGSIRTEMGEGAAAYKDAMGGSAVPSVSGFKAGTENTRQAMGTSDADLRVAQIEATMGGKPGAAKQIGKNYFDPNARAGANTAATHAAEKKVDKAEGQLATDKKDLAYVEKRADAQQAKLDADPTQKNFKNAANAAKTAEQHEAKVEAGEANLSKLETQAKLTEHRQEIVTGRQGENPGGSTGDAADSARKQGVENYGEEAEKGKEKTADEAFETMREGQAPVEATKDAKGHVQLPDPPGSLQDVEGIDHQIEELRHQQEEAGKTGSDAKHVQKETGTQASGLDTASAGVTAKISGEAARSAAAQGAVKTQNADMTAKTAAAGSSTAGGITQGAGPITGIASAARTIDGFLGGVPSNKFFDISGTKNNVHQFVVGLDAITGAPGQHSATQGAATGAVATRTAQVGDAQSKNAAANTEGNKLATDMKTDAGTAKTAASQAGGVAAEAKTAEDGAKAKIAQLTQQRQQKWGALLGWASQHRALRMTLNEKEKSEPVQRKANGAAPSGPGVVDAAHAGVAGTGGRLPHFERIQRSFGRHDISGIQAHMGGQAADASAAIGAQAYATGNNIAFASSSPDLHTAAHEAAHTVQQRSGVQLKGGVGEEGDTYEKHADAVADAVVAGRSAEGLLDGVTGVGGGGGTKRSMQRKAADDAASQANTKELKYRDLVGEMAYEETKDMSPEQREAYFKEEKYKDTVGERLYGLTKHMSTEERRRFYAQDLAEQKAEGEADKPKPKPKKHKKLRKPRKQPHSIRFNADLEHGGRPDGPPIPDASHDMTPASANATSRDGTSVDSTDENASRGAVQRKASGAAPTSASAAPGDAMAGEQEAPEAESEDKQPQNQNQKQKQQPKVLSTATNVTLQPANDGPAPALHKKPAIKKVPPVKHSGGEGEAAGAAAKGLAGAAKDPTPKNTSGIEVTTTRIAGGDPSTSRTQVGVGEEVTFHQSDDGEWAADGAAFGKDSSGVWTAPDKAGSVVITKTVKGGAPKKLTMSVLAPTGINFMSRGAAPVAPAGVGMTTNVQILPNVVSFGACSWLEEPGGADGVSGYFAAYVSQAGGDLSHKPNPEWKSMGDNNQAIDDRAWTSDKPPLTHEDGSKRYWAGGFSWAIPNKYKVGGGGENVFTTVTQAFSMDDKGTTTVTKGSATATARADGVVETDLEKAKDVGEAHAMLNRLYPNRRAMVNFILQYKSTPTADADTLKYLVQALTADNIQLYVSVSCTNTYSWVEKDDVVVTAIGGKAQQQYSFSAGSQGDKGKGGHDHHFNLADLINYGTSDGIVFNVGVENKYTFSANMPSPYESMTGQSLPGSDGRYWITAFIQ